MQEIRFPRLAARMDQATLAAWLVEPGQPIAQGQPLCDVTFDKVTIEVPSPAAGRVQHMLPDPGDLVRVDQVIAILAEAPLSERDLAGYPAFAPAPPIHVTCDIIPEPGDELVPLDAMRTVISQRMSLARHEMPHFYVTTVVDMSAAIALRQRLKREKKWRVSYNDMLIKAAGLACRRFPQVASLFTNAGFVRRDHMHIGFAVALEPDGLVVPVVRNVDERPLHEVSQDAKELTQRARKKRLTPDHYGFGVFTVSNLGTFEVDQFTAIINPQNAAILAVGKLVEEPVAIDGVIEIRPRVKITLSSDHRVIDGALAARFNGALKHLMENPEELLESTP